MRPGWILQLEGRPGGKVPVFGTMRIGREPSNDVVIHCQGVAAHHLTIVADGDGFWAEPVAGAPLGCNGERLAARRRLSAGDRLALGEARLVVCGAASPPGRRRGIGRWLPWVAGLVLVVGGLAHAASSLPNGRGSDLESGEDGRSQVVGGCGDVRCREEAERLKALGSRLWDERELAPGRSFEAWVTWKKARGIVGEAEADPELHRQLENVEAELERRCGALRFAFSKHLALGETRRATQVLTEMKGTFPGTEHRCSAEIEALESQIERATGEGP